MSVNDQSNNQSEGSFNICGGSENAMKLEDNTNMEKLENNTNMDVDKTTVVSGAASGSEGIIVVPAVATLQAGIVDGDGVSSAPTLQAGIADVPGPPPGNWAQTSEAAPIWFAGAVQASVQAAMTADVPGPPPGNWAQTSEAASWRRYLVLTLPR